MFIVLLFYCFIVLCNKIIMALLIIYTPGTCSNKQSRFFVPTPETCSLFREHLLEQARKQQRAAINCALLAAERQCRVSDVKSLYLGSQNMFWVLEDALGVRTCLVYFPSLRINSKKSTGNYGLYINL